MESDAIIYLPDGRWAAIEVKLVSYQIDSTAKNLLAMQDKVDTSKMN